MSRLGRGDARTEKWPDNFGDPTRDGHPNEIVYSPTGEVAEERWKKFGLMTRVDGPAEILHGQGDPPLRIERWFRDGIPYRDDGLAEVMYREEDGSLRAEHYYADGVRHRNGAPASVGYDPDGSVAQENFYDRGVLSRIDGPAIVERDNPGPGGYALRVWSLTDPSRLTKEEWRVHSQRFSSHAELLTKARELSEHEVRPMLEASALAPLLDEGVSVDTLLSCLESGVCTPDGVREVVERDTPAEWVAAWEAGNRA